MITEGGEKLSFLYTYLHVHDHALYGAMIGMTRAGSTYVLQCGILTVFRCHSWIYWKHGIYTYRRWPQLGVGSRDGRLDSALYMISLVIIQM